MQAFSTGVGSVALLASLRSTRCSSSRSQAVVLTLDTPNSLWLDMSIIWHVSEVCASSMALVFSSTFSHCGYDGAERDGADKCQRQGRHSSYII